VSRQLARQPGDLAQRHLPLETRANAPCNARPGEADEGAPIPRRRRTRAHPDDAKTGKTQRRRPGNPEPSTRTGPRITLTSSTPSSLFLFGLGPAPWRRCAAPSPHVTSRVLSNASAPTHATRSALEPHRATRKTPAFKRSSLCAPDVSRYRLLPEYNPKYTVYSPES